jgi:multidrug transporter EmrE-like cation transporter
VPVFGLFLVTSLLVGVLVLGENLTLPKVTGISLALLFIVVLSIE